MSHAETVRLAEQAGVDLEKLFHALGDSEHTSGSVMVAYRIAHKRLDDALSLDPPSLSMAQTAINDLRATLSAEARSQIAEGIAVGIGSAEAMLTAYGATAAATAVQVGVLVDAALFAIEQQMSQAWGLIVLRGGAALPEVIGTATSVGVLTPSPVLQAVTRQIVTGYDAGWNQTIAASVTEEDVWHKQAVAALDERTTDCCLRVHGQTQPLDEPFILTGTPRYASQMDGPPFHRYCRTSTALVLAEEADDRLTNEMRDAAQAEITAREDGSRQEINPADARSRRR